MQKLEIGQKYISKFGTIIEVLEVTGEERGRIKFIHVNEQDALNLFITPKTLVSCSEFRIINGNVEFTLIDHLFVGAEVFEQDDPPVDIQEKGTVIAINDKECVVAFDPEISGFVVYDRANWNKLKPYPLFWKNDTPIYRGMTLYYSDGAPATVENIWDGKVVVKTEGYGFCHENVGDLSLTAPVKVTKWVNVYTNKMTGDTWLSRVYLSKEDAFASRDKSDNYRTTTAIEWEE